MITVTVSDQKTIDELKQMGFSDDYVETPRRLIVSSRGLPKTGKTTFATSAPPPIIYFDIDVGTEGVIGKVQDMGKYVLRYEVRAPKAAIVSESDQKNVYAPLWRDLQTRARKAWSLGSGTVIFDTDSELYELSRLAKFGKLSQVPAYLYSEVNKEFIEFLRLAYDSPMNTVFIHKVKPVWINKARTGEYELSGPDDMGYLSQVNLVHYREETEDEIQFSALLEDCRFEPSIAGTLIEGLPISKSEPSNGYDPLCNFDTLLNLVHGEE